MLDSLEYAARSKAEGGNCWPCENCRFSVGVWSHQSFFSQSSKPNELIFNTMFYDSVCVAYGNSVRQRVILRDNASEYL